MLCNIVIAKCFKEVLLSTRYKISKKRFGKCLRRDEGMLHININKMFGLSPQIILEQSMGCSVHITLIDIVLKTIITFKCIFYI